MKLTKEEKELIKAIIWHPWWAIVKKLEEESKAKLWIALLDVDLSNTEHLELIKRNQIYMKARKDFVENIEKNNIEVFSNDMQLF